MKTCDEMVNSLFERREQYLAEQKRKRRNAVISAALYCCVFAVIGGIALSVKQSASRQTETIAPSSDAAANSHNMTSPLSEGESSAPLPSTAPESFESFDDFEEHEKNAKTNAVSFYYVPASVPSGFELTEIAKRNNVYVSVTYSIPDTALSVYDAQENAGLNSYDASRLQTLICERSLSTDGQSTLETSFIANGYEPIEYKGRTYYRWDEHAENDPEKRVIGYELAFLDDGNLIFLHLPAIDTFENMMRYADVAKVEIEGEPDIKPDLPVVWCDGVDFRALGYWEHDVQEWNGKTISNKLYDALDKNDENCLFAVTAEYFWKEEEAVYNGKTVAQYREEASAKDHELYVLERLLYCGDDLKYGEALYQTGTPDGVKWGESLYKETVSMIGQDIIDKYIVDDVFLKNELSQDIEKATGDCKTASQAWKQASIGYPTQVYETLGKQLKAKGNRYIVCDSDGIFLLMFISKDDLADLTPENVNYWEFRHASKENDLPIVWAEGGIEGELVTDYYTEWNGKQIHNLLWDALEKDENNDNSLFAVSAYYGKLDEQFIYNGKTLAQYEKEAQGKRLDNLHQLLKQGEALKYGEALYKSGTPDGEKWSKELYDKTVAEYGEDMLSEYIVDGVFLKDKVLQDIPEAEKELEAARKSFERACAAYRAHIYRETVDSPELKGLKYELDENSGNLTLYLTKEEFADLTLDNMSDWTFFLASKSEKVGLEPVNE